MLKEKSISIESEFSQFHNLQYNQKLEFFHNRFGLIPIKFPKFDIDFCWDVNDYRFKKVVESFNSETRNRDIYHKELRENQQTFIFDIQPNAVNQRILYNEFVLSIFLKSNDKIEADLKAILSKQPHAIKYIKKELLKIDNVIDWIEKDLQLSQKKISLKGQFLKLFYTGFLSFKIDTEQNLRVKRKFSELYIFSQGFLFASYQAQLHKCLMELTTKKATVTPLNLPSKIILLKRLGIIDFLYKKYGNFVTENLSFSQLICLIISENVSHDNIISNYLTGLNYSDTRNTGTDIDTKKVENLLKTLKSK